MKYTLPLLLFFCTSIYPIETNVYICGATGAKKYHYNANCRGLNSCSHGVVKKSLKQAQGFGLTLCGWED